MQVKEAMSDDVRISSPNQTIREAAKMMAEIDAGITKERIRQIGKRASKVMAELAESHPKFAVRAEYRKPRRMAA